VTVKAVVTERLKEQLAADFQAALARLDGAPAPDELGSAERSKRLQQREQLLARMKELAKLELGTEVVQGTVEGEIEVRTGDEWGRLSGAEIVLKDGRVVAIRE
jgi:hypothetical protein